MRLTTLPRFFAVVMISGNLNLLEHSGPIQACNETVLPFIPHDGNRDSVQIVSACFNSSFLSQSDEECLFPSSRLSIHPSVRRYQNGLPLDGLSSNLA